MRQSRSFSLCKIISNVPTVRKRGSFAFPVKSEDSAPHVVPNDARSGPSRYRSSSCLMSPSVRSSSLRPRYSASECLLLFFRRKKTRHHSHILFCHPRVSWNPEEKDYSKRRDRVCQIATLRSQRRCYLKYM